MADMSDHELEKKRQRAELAKMPIGPIMGIVSPSGIGLSKTMGDQFWSASLPLLAWRTAGEPIKQIEVQLRKEIPGRDSDSAFPGAEPHKVVRLTGKILLEVAPMFRPTGEVDDYFGPDDSDAELNALAVTLQQPVTFEDQKLGTFTLDRSLGWFEATPKWNRKPVRLSLMVEREGSQFPKKALEKAHALWESAKDWDERLRDYACEELLELKNRSWLDEDESPLTKRELKRRLSLDAISIGRRVEFFLECDGIFADHGIRIVGTLKNGLESADLC